MSKSEKKTSIINLKPNQENVHIVARVLEAGPPHVIQTRKGPRTISDAVLGDESGRIRVTLWGRKAGSLKEGDVVEIEGAWTSSFRGQVQLNIGSQTKVSTADEDSVPTKDSIPEKSPKAPNTSYRGYRRSYKGKRGKY